MPDAYDQWAERHAAAFGLRSDEDGRSLLVWSDLFRHGGVTAAELLAATNWLALHEPPRFLNQHLAALRDRIDAQRRQQIAAVRTEAPDFGTCNLCGGAGMVCVPSLAAMELGLWGSQATICPCALGRWVFQRQRGTGPSGEARPPLMTLEEYELRCPNWRTLLAQHTDECVRRLRAKYGQMCGPLDDALNAIADRVRGMRGG